MACEDLVAKNPKTEGDKQFLFVIRHGDRFDYSHPEVGSAKSSFMAAMIVKHFVKTQLCVFGLLCVAVVRNDNTPGGSTSEQTGSSTGQRNRGLCGINSSRRKH
jgi:hypothetical protein